MEELVYKEMTGDEEALDWRITRQVMADQVLMQTLEGSQAQGEKHAVIALVEQGKLVETSISPEAAVKKRFPFDPVSLAFQYYDPKDGVCLVIVRDGKVVISLNALRPPTQGGPPASA
jgi:hypothetical protein